MKKINILFFHFLVVVNITTAQSINDVTYFNYSLLSKANFETKNGSTAINRFELNVATPPIQIGKNVKLINSAYYQNNQFDYSSTFVSREILPSKLHDIRYNATMFMQIHKNWEILALARVLVRSDLKQSLSSNDFFLSSTLALVHSIKGNQNFKIGLGIIPIDNDFNRNAVFPGMIMLYSNEKLKIEVVYPRAAIIYKQSPNLEFGLFSMIEGSISHVSPSNISNETIQYFRTFQWVVAPAISHRIYRNLFAHLKVGYGFLPKIELLNKDFETLKNQNYDLKSSLYLRTGISLRIPN
jgi:hypothetical protein